MGLPRPASGQRRELARRGTRLAVGLLAAAAVSGLFRGLFFGVAPIDPLTFATIALALSAVALAAAALAARRATRVDPLDCLRAE